MSGRRPPNPVKVLERDSIRFPVYGLVALGVAALGFRFASYYEDWIWAIFAWVLSVLAFVNILVGMRKYFYKDWTQEQQQPRKTHTPLRLEYTLTSTIFYRFILCFTTAAIGFNADKIGNDFLAVVSFILSVAALMVLFAELLRDKTRG